MHKLIVQNFGPITNCAIDLKEFTILIGPQSSGKSTISKLIYFFLNVRDEYVRFLLDSIDSNDEKIDVRAFNKLLRKIFVEFWGPTPLKSDVYIKFEYSTDTWIEIKLDSVKHRYINPNLSPSIISSMHKSFQDAKKISSELPTSNSSKLFDTVNNISAERSKDFLIEDLKRTSKNLFVLEKELLFIPAGRSLLSTLSDQLQYIHPHQLDYPMRRFIERINLTKSFFGKSTDEIIAEKQALGNSNVWFSAVRKVSQLIKKILRGEFIHDKDGGKLYVDKNTYTKINFASSGQQESIWILLSMFLVVLEKVDALIFIEEPEAHLFPVAQKEIVELMCFLAKTVKTNFIITSHSPYVLSAINNHIYASTLGIKNKEKVNNVIPETMWLNPNHVNGYFVHNGQLSQLFDKELNMLKTELIDTASDLVNQEYTQLFDIENE